MPQLISSIACNLDPDILAAALPLFEAEKIEGLEWSFDALHRVEQVPGWFRELLSVYSSAGRLVGHGVYFSLFSGRWSSEQEQWLQNLKTLRSEFTFDHISEHFGFMTGKNFHHGAPLSVPFSERTLRIGRDRLSRIYDACRCPVGLENLAFAYSLDEVRKHGEFLDQLIEPVNGFIILDLHNLYCQMHNFSVGYEDISKLYPLHRVREIHISGGSWEDSSLSSRKVRRDTHDDSVPEEVFTILKSALTGCPNLKFVVMEQLGTALKTTESRQHFAEDFLRMQDIVTRSDSNIHNAGTNDFIPHAITLSGKAESDEDLHRQQIELSDILENASSYNDAHERLQSSSLAGTDWETEQWEPAMIETAMKIAQKWK